MPVSESHTGWGHRGAGGRLNSSDISAYYAGTEVLRMNATELNPGASNTIALGTTTLPFSDLRLGSGGVIDFNNNVTLTHGTDTLTLAGGDFVVAGGNLVVDQAAEDIAILDFRSSDVVSNITDLTLGPDVGINTFFAIGKIAGATGGAYLIAIDESASEALHIESWGGAPATTDTSSSLAAINIFVGQHDGSNADVDMATNSNAVAMGEIDASGVRQTRFVLKADDGELHLGNATNVALDTEDDVLLVRALHKESTNGGIVETPYDANPFYNYEKLRELGIVGEKAPDGHYLFALQPRLTLHEGAMWQLFNEMMDVVKALPEEIQKRLPNRIQSRLAQ